MQAQTSSNVTLCAREWKNQGREGIYSWQIVISPLLALVRLYIKSLHEVHHPIKILHNSISTFHSENSVVHQIPIYLGEKVYTCKY